MMMRAKRFDRSSNRAGGLEGGITNGQDVVVRGYLKPISTLRRALLTADMDTKEAIKAAYERSDCVRGAGGRRGGRGDGGVRTGRCVPGKIWRRFARRNAAEFRRLSRQLEEF